MVRECLLAWLLASLILTICIHGYNTGDIMKPRISLDSFPNPMRSPANCGQIIPSMICDPNGYLTNEQSIHLHNDIINANTNENLIYCSNECRLNTIGIEIGIAIIDTFRNYNYDYNYNYNYFNNYSNINDTNLTINNELSKYYSQSIYNQWNIGNLCCQNGVLILISIQDNCFYIWRDNPILLIITDDIISNFIIPVIQPLFIKRDYYAVISKVK